MRGIPDDPSHRGTAGRPRGSRAQAVIGLDVGGSSTRGLLAADGVVVASAQEGAANPNSVGPDVAARRIRAVLDTLGGVEVSAVCAGAAGADTESGRAALTSLLVAALPTARVRVVHDSHLLLAAAGLEHGIALIAGTGSVAWGRTSDGHSARAGGWGYLLGDEGSGFAVAMAAVRHALGRVDQGKAADPLTRRLVEAAGADSVADLLDLVYGQPDRSAWARRAVAVFDLADGADPAALGLVESAGRALADLAGTVSTRLDLAGPVVLGGGLLVHQPRLQDAVRRHLDGGLRADVRILAADPVEGAVRLAQHLLDAPSPEATPVTPAPEATAGNRDQPARATGPVRTTQPGR